MIMPAWYDRMNQRERVLAMIVAGILFALINWLFSAIGRGHAELATRKETRKQQTIYVNERDLWTKRAEWVQQHQPVLRDAGEASKLLEEQLRPVADKYKVLLENPQIGSGETTPNHQTVFATFETVNLSVDSNEPTMMRGKFKVARWFAPAQRKG